MTDFKKNPWVIMASMAALLVLIGLINFNLEKNTKEGFTAIKPTPADKTEQNTPKSALSTSEHTLVPDDPAKYGIIIQSSEEVAQTPAQWDEYMKKVIVDKKILDDPNAAPAIEIMKKKPEDFQKRMQEIDERIAQYEKKIRNNPGDENTDKHLQTLYMLKSLGKALENKVVKE